MKRNKDDYAVQYMDHPRGNEQCDRCTMFRPPCECTAINGPVIGLGHCFLFKAKYGKQHEKT